MIELLQSFNAGELSPLLDARTTLDKYKSGCQTLQNFVIMPYGGVNRRPGLEFVAQAKYADKPCRLLGFNFSTTTRFVIEIGHEYMRFFANRVPIYDSGGSLLEITTPYQYSDLKELQFFQINDILYISHSNYPPYKLSRIADNNWTIAKVVWDYPPTLEENTTTTTISASADTGSVTLTASASIFAADHVGTQWGILWDRKTSSISQGITGNAYSTVMDCSGSWDLTTFGTWTATIRLLRNSKANQDAGVFDTSKMQVIREWTSNNDRNVSASGTETDRVGLVVQVLNYSSNTNGRVVLESRDFTTGGTVTITAVTSGTVATATVNRWLGKSYSTPTTRWSEAAFSTLRGFPRAVSMHQQRICYAGTSSHPNTLWASAINDYQNFRIGSLDSDALRFTLAASEGNRATWMYSQQQLLVGTSGDEWSIGAADTTKAFSSSNVIAKRQSSYGSKYMRAAIVNDVLLFVQRNGRKVRELVYSLQKDGWVASDLTLLCEHISRGEISEICYQQQPDAILWCVTGNGTLAGMTYEKDQTVVGWHRHTTDGAFESVTTIYGNGTEDEVWTVVNRTVNGQAVRYIESFSLNWRTYLDNGDKANWFYVDAGIKIINNTPSTTVAGLSHLVGKAVSVLTDGAVHPDCVVSSSGTITLDYPATIVAVGLPYTSLLQTMKFDAALQDGTAQGRKQKLNRVRARIYKSLTGEFSTDGVNFDTIPARDFADPMDDSPPPFTGEKHITVASGYKDSMTLFFRQQQPIPLTLIALIAKWESSGD